MIKTLSLFDTLRFNALYSIPNYLQGLFTRRRFWVGFWTRLRIDRLAVRFASRLRNKYGSTYFMTRAGGSPAVLVLDPEGIKHVLGNSPFVYADAESKRKGMSHFQPGALTISRGEEWKRRRQFNEAVLNTSDKVHVYADRFLHLTETATLGMRAAAGSQLRWKHFDELFEQIAAGIIFGLDPGNGRPLFDRLGKLMRESNRVFGLKKSKHFDDFYTGIRSQLAGPCAESLVSLCTRVPSTAATRVENQIPHWMFAIRETLAINTVRALALIISHPEQEMRVRAELVWSDRLTPGVVSNLKYLEGCVQEAMRLWPTTPFLAREVLAADTLGGSSVAGGTQILILNTFNHRDRESIAEADTFCPEQWLEGPPDFLFNHLSAGPQVCAGKNLALFISKAVLATLLRAGHYTLLRPRMNYAKPVPSMCNHFRIVFRQR